MVSWLGILDDNEQFEEVLDLICKDDCQQLETIIPIQDQVFQRYLQSSQAKFFADMPAETLRPIEQFTLFLMVIFVRTLTDRFPQEDLAVLLLVFARRIFYAFQYQFIRDRELCSSLRSIQKSRQWFLNVNESGPYLEELAAVLSPTVLRDARTGLKGLSDKSSLSREYKRGVERFYRSVCERLGVPSNLHNSHPVGPDNKVEANTVNIPPEMHWEPPDEQIHQKQILSFLPLFHDYFESSALIEAYNALWKQEKRVPTMRVAIEHMLSSRLSQTSLNADQKVMARDILQDIHCWGLAWENAQYSFSRRDLDFYAKQQYYSKDFSTIIDQLLSCELLSMNSNMIVISDPAIRDFMITASYQNKHHLMSLYGYGGFGIKFSTWLYWILDHLVSKGELENAGISFCMVQGVLPGFASHSWQEVLQIVAFLPGKALLNPYIWGITRVALFIAEHRVKMWDPNLAPLFFETKNRFPLHYIGKPESWFPESIDRYLDAYEKYITEKETHSLSVDGTDEQRSKRISKFLGRLRWNRDRYCQIHALSDLRNIMITRDNSDLSLQASPLWKSLRSWTRRADVKVCLTMGELAILNQIINDYEIFDLQDDWPQGSPIKGRRNILAMAAKYPAEYLPWV